MHSHIHVAQVAVQVFNDMCMLAAVEDRQGPRIALVPHIGICWIDGDSSQVYHKVASKDGTHALAQQVKDSVRTLQTKSPTHFLGRRTHPVHAGFLYTETLPVLRSPAPYQISSSDP